MNLITDLCYEKVIGVRNRNKIYPLGDKINFDSDCFGEEVVDAYHSAYMFSMSMDEHVKATGSVANYEGSVSSSYLFWDLDSDDDPNLALKDGRELLSRLYDMGAEEENIQVWWSGNKGIHLIFASKDISKYSGSSGLHNLTRGVCAEIAEGMTTFDSAVYDKTRLIRVSNSKHKKSGLYKIPISQFDLNNKTADEIREMAKEQVEREVDLVPCSIDYISTFLKGLVSNGVASNKKNPLKTTKNDIFYGIANGFKKGERNNGLTSVAGLYHSHGFTGECLYNMVSSVNELGDPVNEDDLMSIIKSVERYPVKPEYEEPDDDDFVTMEQAGKSWMWVKKNRKNLKTGWHLLDEGLQTFDPGKVLLVAARAGVGKTNIAMQMANSLAKNLECMNVFMSLEMSKAAVFYRASVIDQSRTGELLDNVDMTEALYNQEELRTRTHDNWANTVLVTKGGININQVETYAIKAKEKYKNEELILTLDYMGLLSGTDDYKSLSKTAKELKNIAKRLNIRIIMLVQLSRLAEDGTIEPTINMLRDSGALEEAADIILGLWNDPNNLMRMHCKFIKNRDGVRGLALDLIQNGLAYLCEPFQASARPNKGNSGRSWSPQ